MASRRVVLRGILVNRDSVIADKKKKSPASRARILGIPRERTIIDTPTARTEGSFRIMVDRTEVD